MTKYHICKNQEKIGCDLCEESTPHVRNERCDIRCNKGTHFVKSCELMSIAEYAVWRLTHGK